MTELSFGFSYIYILVSCLLGLAFGYYNYYDVKLIYIGNFS